MMTQTISSPTNKTYKFLEKVFREYYSEALPSLPRDYKLREFAAQLWGQNTYIRHLSFKSEKEVRDFLSQRGPRHFYYSSARYKYPEARDMESKEWLSADLIFDIDANHLEECKDKIIELEVNGQKTSFIEDECLCRAAFEALKLVDTLIHELGISKESIRVEFSGNRGFHVVVEDDKEWGLAESDVRRELVNYLLAVDIKEESLQPKIEAKRIKTRMLPPLISSPGIRGRLARIAVRLATIKGLETLSRYFSNIEEYLMASPSEKDKLLELIEEAKEHIKIRVDEQVTVDTKRLIRPPGSLHGKTGLLVKPVDVVKVYEDCATLLEEASPFIKRNEYLRVKAIVDTPVLRILGNKIKLRKGVIYRLPLHIAIYLMAKSVAVIV
ncbi:MAG: DNA primase catalytic subunit PriS [Pyrodictiaceae archaeon]